MERYVCELFLVRLGGKKDDFVACFVLQNLDIV
jgi:hypothetical protein